MEDDQRDYLDEAFKILAEPRETLLMAQDAHLRALVDYYEGRIALAKDVLDGINETGWEDAKA